MSRPFSKEVKMANKYLKKCPTSFSLQRNAKSISPQSEWQSLRKQRGLGVEQKNHNTLLVKV
jgi:hypothetical protein